MTLLNLTKNLLKGLLHENLRKKQVALLTQRNAVKVSSATSHLYSRIQEDFVVQYRFSYTNWPVLRGQAILCMGWQPLCTCVVGCNYFNNFKHPDSESDVLFNNKTRLYVIISPFANTEAKRSANGSKKKNVFFIDAVSESFIRIHLNESKSVYPTVYCASYCPPCIVCHPK